MRMGDAVESKKLLGLTPSHAGSQARGGKNCEYLHTGRSIALRAAGPWTGNRVRNGLQHLSELE